MWQRVLRCKHRRKALIIRESAGTAEGGAVREHRQIDVSQTVRGPDHACVACLSVFAGAELFWLAVDCLGWKGKRSGWFCLFVVLVVLTPEALCGSVRGADLRGRVSFPQRGKKKEGEAWFLGRWVLGEEGGRERGEEKRRANARGERKTTGTTATSIPDPFVGGLGMSTRRAGGGAGGSGGGMGAHAARVNEANQGLLEQENNSRINELEQQVSMLKSVSIDIGSEVRAQNDLLDGMDQQFSGVQGLLGQTISKIGAMTSSGGGKHMLYLAVFVVVVFLLLYWMISSTRSTAT